ncbi:MAG: transposase [Deltaproteobacteria bacterium]|nr:transposase [Deltaproteobacteria bacterium]
MLSMAPMARPLRIEYPDAWYHVMNRGRRGEDIFSDDQDYSIFTELLRETSEIWNVRIAAYCLMPNHYHMLVQTPAANISRSMRHLNGVYTQRDTIAATDAMDSFLEGATSPFSSALTATCCRWFDISIEILSGPDW